MPHLPPCLYTMPVASLKRRRDENEPTPPDPDFGSTVSKRMRQTYGNIVRPGLWNPPPPVLNAPRPISPDLMEAIHLGDRAFFLFSQDGVKYFLWRSWALRSSPRKSYLDNVFGILPTFQLSVPRSTTIQQEACTYAYLYACWARSEMPNPEKWDRFLFTMAKQNGATNTEDVRNAWTRINYHMAKAVEMWHTRPSRDEIVAYLSAAEQTWWKPETEVVRDFKATPRVDVMAGAPDYYQRDMDAGHEAAAAHGERGKAIYRQMQGDGRKRTGAAGVNEDSPKTIPSALLLSCVGGDQSTQSLQISQVEDNEMEKFFEFDHAIDDGLCMQNVVKSVEGIAPTPSIHEEEEAVVHQRKDSKHDEGALQSSEDTSCNSFETLKKMNHMG